MAHSILLICMMPFKYVCHHPFVRLTHPEREKEKEGGREDGRGKSMNCGSVPHGNVSSRKCIFPRKCIFSRKYMVVCLTEIHG